MRIAHLSDLHVIDGVRLDDHRDTLHNIVSDVLDLHPDLVLITGDLAGRAVPHRTTPRERNVLYPEIVRLADAAPVIILYGNHDQAPDMDAMVNLDGRYAIQALKGAGEMEIATAEGPCWLYWLAYPTKRWLLANETVSGLQDSQRIIQHKLATLCELWGHKIRGRRRKHPGVPHVFAGHLQIGGSRTSGGEVLAGQEIELQRSHLEGLGVDYGALGHIHLRQEVARRCWYAGSTWRNDFGETEEWKGWNLVDVGPRDQWPIEPLIMEGEPQAVACSYYEARNDDGEIDARVLSMPSNCRRFVTLDYRWGVPNDGEPPRWERDGLRALLLGAAVQTQNPTVWNTAENREAVRKIIADAEVRMRLIVPQQWASTCPWDEEIEGVRALGPHRLIPERKVEPILRVRAPAVAAAETLFEKVGAYWDTLGTKPGDDEQAVAYALIDELETQEDEVITARLQDEVEPAAPAPPVATVAT